MTHWTRDSVPAGAGRQDVDGEVPGRGEACLGAGAVGTLVRSLCSMGVQVVTKVILPPELLVTLRTVEGSLPGVDPLMNLQVVSLAKHSVTILTGVGLLLAPHWLADAIVVVLDQGVKHHHVEIVRTDHVGVRTHVVIVVMVSSRLSYLATVLPVYMMIHWPPPTNRRAPVASSSSQSQGWIKYSSRQHLGE